MRVSAATQRRCVPPSQTKENEAPRVLFELFWCFIPLPPPPPLTPPPQKNGREAKVEPSFGKVQRRKVANASTGSSNGRTSGGRKCMQYWRCAVLWLAVVNCEPDGSTKHINSVKMKLNLIYAVGPYFIWQRWVVTSRLYSTARLSVRLHGLR